MQGTGPIGLSAIMLLRLGGASKIIALTISDEKSKLALEYGADVALDVTKEGDGLVEKVRSLTGGRGVDIAYECVGGPGPVDNCLSITRSDAPQYVAGP